MVPPTPWIQRTFNFDFPSGYFPIIYCRLEGTIYRLKGMLNFPDDFVANKKDNGWSVNEHVGHLFDLEELWWKRLEEFQKHSKVLTAADMTNRKTYEADHDKKSLQFLINDFENERQKMLKVIYSFDEEKLLQKALHPRLKVQLRMIDYLFFIAEHDDHHLAAISILLHKNAL